MIQQPLDASDPAADFMSLKPPAKRHPNATRPHAGRCHFDNLPPAWSCIPAGFREEYRPLPPASPNASSGNGTCVLHPAASPCTRRALEDPRVCPVKGESELWFYGGSGVVFSRGMIEAVGEKGWRAAEDALKVGGGGDGSVTVRWSRPAPVLPPRLFAAVEII